MMTNDFASLTDALPIRGLALARWLGVDASTLSAYRSGVRKRAGVETAISPPGSVVRAVECARDMLAAGMTPPGWPG